jgi:hypothetical protein
MVGLTMNKSSSLFVSGFSEQEVLMISDLLVGLLYFLGPNIISWSAQK